MSPGEVLTRHRMEVQEKMVTHKLQWEAAVYVIPDSLTAHHHNRVVGRVLRPLQAHPLHNEVVMVLEALKQHSHHSSQLNGTDLISPSLTHTHNHFTPLWILSRTTLSSVPIQNSVYLLPLVP